MAGHPLGTTKSLDSNRKADLWSINCLTLAIEMGPSFGAGF